MATEDEEIELSTLNESDVEEKSKSQSSGDEEITDNEAQVEETTKAKPEAQVSYNKYVKVKEISNDSMVNVRNERKSIDSKGLSCDTIQSSGTVRRQSEATSQNILSRTSRDDVNKDKSKETDIENTKEQRIRQLHNERRSELERRKKADEHRRLSDDERAMKDNDYQNSINKLCYPLYCCSNESNEQEKDHEPKQPGDDKESRKSRLLQRNEVYRYGIPKPKPSPSRDTKLLKRVEDNRGKTTWEPQQTEPKTNKERRSRPTIDNVYEKLMKKK